MPYLSEQVAATEFMEIVAGLRGKHPRWREPTAKSQNLFNKSRGYYGSSPKKHPNVGTYCRQLDCLNPPIKNSHTIAESMLRHLAVDSHLVSPNIQDASAPQDRLVGQGQASTFNGYCVTHEKLFSATFEQKGFTEDFHYTLQIMRSTAREIWKLESYLGYLELNIVAYETSVQELNIPPGAKKELKKRASFPLRSMKANAENQLDQLKHMLKWLTPAAVDGQPLPSKVQILNLKTDYHVALSGSTHFTDAKRGSASGLERVFPFTVVFTIVPKSAGSLFIFATSGDAVDLSLYVEQYFSVPEKVAKTVFSWMEHTDHWFANPTWWGALDQQVRNTLLSRLAHV